MYCNHCGKENEDNSAICQFCGQEIQQTPIAEHTEDLQSDNLSDSVEQISSKIKSISDRVGEETKATTSKAIENIKNNKEKSKKMLGIICACLVFVVACSVLFLKLSSSVSIKDYAVEDLKFTGLNGYGSVGSVNEIINWNELNSEIKKEKRTDKDIIDYDSLATESILNGGHVSESINSYVTVKLDEETKNGHLSNGDKVTFILSIDNKGIQKNPYFAKTIKEKNECKITYTVSGLEDGIAIDLFDAVDCYVYDESSYYNQDGLKYKTDYTKEYGNGIETRVEYGNVRIYGEDFSSISASIQRVNDKIIDENTKSVKCGINANEDTLMEKGIVLSPTEKDIKVVRLSLADANNITKADVSSLTAKAKDFARLNFEAGQTLSKVKLYYGEGLHPVLAYIFKVSKGYSVVHFDDLKIRSDNGQVYGVEDQEARGYGWFGYSEYESIDKFQQSELSDKAQSIDITIK